MKFMFRNSKSFNSPVDKWDVAKVTDMEGMFYESAPNEGKFDQDISKWKAGKVTTMSFTFAGHHLGPGDPFNNGGKDLGGLDVQARVNMHVHQLKRRDSTGALFCAAPCCIRRFCGP